MPKHEDVTALAARLKEDGVEFTPPPGETPEETLLRFLNARQGNILKAAAFLKEDAGWRAAQTIDELREQDAAAVLGCDPAVLFEVPVNKYVPDDKTDIKDNLQELLSDA